MSWRQELDELQEQRRDGAVRPSSWSEIADQAEAQKQAGMLVHALGLTADQLRASRLHTLDADVRDALVELSEKFDGADRLDILAEYDTEAALTALHHNTRGTLMELEVEQLFDHGDLELPDGAVTFDAAGRSEPRVDGWFMDADGDIVQEMQIKASDDAAIILRHLREHPEVPHVYTTTEAADAAARHDLPDITDTGITNEALRETVEGELSAAAAGEVLLANVPLLTLGIAAAELARNLHRGMPLDEARRIASRRTGVALSYASIAWLIAAFTQIETLRFGVIVAGEGSRWVIRRLSQELEPSLVHIREQRRVLESLATPGGTASGVPPAAAPA